MNEKLDALTAYAAFVCERVFENFGDDIASAMSTMQMAWEMSLAETLMRADPNNADKRLDDIMSHTKANVLSVLAEGMKRDHKLN